jgi:hypothetical protein
LPIELIPAQSVAHTRLQNGREDQNTFDRCDWLHVGSFSSIIPLWLTLSSGGSVLTELIDRGFADQQHISALVRQPYQASILTDAGIEPVIFKDLDDFDNIREAAKDHDSMNQISQAHSGQ